MPYKINGKNDDENDQIRRRIWRSSRRKEGFPLLNWNANHPSRKLRVEGGGKSLSGKRLLPVHLNRNRSSKK